MFTYVMVKESMVDQLVNSELVHLYRQIRSKLKDEIQLAKISPLAM